MKIEAKAELQSESRRVKTRIEFKWERKSHRTRSNKNKRTVYIGETTNEQKEKTFSFFHFVLVWVHRACDRCFFFSSTCSYLSPRFDCSCCSAFALLYFGFGVFEFGFTCSFVCHSIFGRRSFSVVCLTRMAGAFLFTIIIIAWIVRACTSFYRLHLEFRSLSPVSGCCLFRVPSECVVDPMLNYAVYATISAQYKFKKCENYFKRICYGCCNNLTKNR